MMAALTAFAALTLWPWSYPFTTKDCERIQDGMNRAEVEAILGGLPPGDYRRAIGRDQEFDGVYKKVKTICVGKTVECWQSDNAQLIVIFDKNGRVYSKHFGHTMWTFKDALRDLWSRILRWTGLA
jgi:hypothetical protein